MGLFCTILVAVVLFLVSFPVHSAEVKSEDNKYLVFCVEKKTKLKAVKTHHRELEEFVKLFFPTAICSHHHIIKEDEGKPKIYVCVVSHLNSFGCRLETDLEWVKNNV